MKNNKIIVIYPKNNKCLL